MVHDFFFLMLLFFIIIITELGQVYHKELLSLFCANQYHILHTCIMMYSTESDAANKKAIIDLVRFHSHLISCSNENAFYQQI